MYRADGPPDLQCVGETEFVNGIAAMTASGIYGRFAPAPRSSVTPISRSDPTSRKYCSRTCSRSPRFRGIRQSASFDDDLEVLGPLAGRARRGSIAMRGSAKASRCSEGSDCRSTRGCSNPSFSTSSISRVRFLETTIVLDHVGTPLGIGAYRGRLPERFDAWRQSIRALAACENVVVKLGGLAMPFAGFPWSYGTRPKSSDELGTAWKPYIDRMHRCVRAGQSDVREQLPGRRLHLQLSHALERAQAYCR